MGTARPRHPAAPERPASGPQPAGRPGRDLCAAFLPPAAPPPVVLQSARQGVAGLGLAEQLVPGAVAPDVAAIPLDALRARGLRALIIDLDNTLTRWNDARCAPEVRAWLGRARAGGFGICIVSNNGPERVQGFCDSLGLDVHWIADARKPTLGAYRKACDLLGVPGEAVAAIGDQVFTDVFGGNRAGVFTVLVRPLGRREFPATRLVRLVEAIWLRRLRYRGALRPL